MTQQIGDFYSACMDEGAVESRGVAAIQPELDAIAQIKSAKELTPLVARLQLIYFRYSYNSSLLFFARRDPSVLNNLGLVLRLLGNIDEALALFDEALGLFRERGDKQRTARALVNLGVTHLDQDHDEQGLRCLGEALALQREVGDKRGIANSLYNLGCHHKERGNLSEALSLLEESQALYCEQGDKRGIASVLFSRGTVALEQGDNQEARRLLVEGLERYREIGAQNEVAHSLQALGETAAALGHLRVGVILSAAAHALFAALSAAIPETLRPHFERARQHMREALGDEMFAAAWAEGEQMATEQVLSLVRSLDAYGEPATQAVH